MKDSETKEECYICEPEKWAHKGRGSTVPICEKHYQEKADSPTPPETSSWEEEFDRQFEGVILEQEVRTVIKGIKHFISRVASSEYKRGVNSAVEIIKSHRLTDWSGEAEVEDEIEQIAEKVKSLLAITDEKI